MPEIIIDNHKITVAPGTTLLTAARELGIDIPTLCYLEGLDPFTSCMVCVVQDMRNGKLVPACSMPAQEGMVIETANETVLSARKHAIELLMSEHTGDCEAPCRKGCPAGMNIPLMLRQIANNEHEAALRTVKRDIALPAVLGRICPAPCEKVCNRTKLDGPVAICLLKRCTADQDLKAGKVVPECQPDTGKSVAVVGSGPAGLSAAYYLREMGHACTVFEGRELSGGNLRYAIDAEKLPPDVLDSEIEIIINMGVQIKCNTMIGKDMSIQELQQNFDAVILAVGVIDNDTANRFGVNTTDKGIVVDKQTFATSLDHVYAGGSALRESKMAIRSLAHGKDIAHSIHRFFNEMEYPDNPGRYDSKTGRLAQDELQSLLKNADPGPLQSPKAGVSTGYTEHEAIKQAARCMHCDCRKPEACKLRQYSRLYQADPKHYGGDKSPVNIINQHDLIIYEPGKCIKCGICVQITEKQQEKLGLTFVGRGFDVRINAPFGAEMNDALENTAKECVESCPTAALSFKKDQT